MITVDSRKEVEVVASLVGVVVLDASRKTYRTNAEGEFVERRTGDTFNARGMEGVLPLTLVDAPLDGSVLDDLEHALWSAKHIRQCNDLLLRYGSDVAEEFYDHSGARLKAFKEAFSI